VISYGDNLKGCLGHLIEQSGCLAVKQICGLMRLK